LVAAVTLKAVRLRRAVVDPGLHAVLHDLRPILYSRGHVAEADVPPHVRAASAVRRHGERLVIVQDDVNVLALQHDTGETSAVLLPAGAGGLRTFEEGRGNKHSKMDLEACATLPDGRLIAFGSGSTSARERLVTFDGTSAPRVVDGAELYAALRSETAFSGSELNIEGALVAGDVLRLFQRGNGAKARGLLPVSATCDVPLPEFLAWLDDGARVPGLHDVIQYDLGDAGGVPFTFTDAACMRDGNVAFLACAEASPDTYRDGELHGCRFGIAAGDDVRVTDVRHADGRPTMLKLEGLEGRPGHDTTFDVVVDMDSPEAPALCGRLEVRQEAGRS
jgi:hypothetical protein